MIKADKFVQPKFSNLTIFKPSHNKFGIQIGYKPTDNQNTYIDNQLIVWLNEMKLK